MLDPLNVLTHGLFDAGSLSVHTKGLLVGSTLGSGLLSHPRRAIRESIAARVRAEASATARILVNPGRTIPAQLELPAVLIYLGDEEEVERDADSPRTYRRVTELTAEIVVATGEAFEVVAETIAVILEQVILADPGQAGTAVETDLVGLDEEFRQEGNRQVYSLRLTFAVAYTTLHGVEAPDLAGIDITVDVPPPGDPFMETVDVEKTPKEE